MFKHMNKEVTKLGLIPTREIRPDVLYDGILAGDNKKERLYARDFVCPWCNGTDCSPILDNERGKEWLFCLNQACLTKAADMSRPTGQVAKKLEQTRGF